MALLMYKCLFMHNKRSDKRPNYPFNLQKPLFVEIMIFNGGMSLRVGKRNDIK